VVAIPGEFIEAFDAARYGPTTGRITADSRSQVVDLVRKQIRSNPWPRLRCAATRLQRLVARKVDSENL